MSAPNHHLRAEIYFWRRQGKGRHRSCPAVFLLLALLLVFTVALWGRSEPLTKAEIDQLRETAQEPEKRLALYAKFIQARVDQLEHLRSDPRFAADRESQIHDLLDGIEGLVEEMDDNVQDYASRHADLRKPLQKILQMDSELQSKLRTMKPATGAQQAQSYGFSLENALDSVDSSLDHARHVMKEQEQTFKDAQKKK